MRGAEDEMEVEQQEDEEETIDLVLFGSSEDDNRVMEWEIGLPSADDLMPLSQLLIPPELASAFSISPEPRRSSLEVNRASQTTFASLRNHQNPSFPSNCLKPLPSFEDERVETGNSPKDATESRKVRRLDVEEGDSALNSMDDQSNRTIKRPRLVWNPQLHKRFVDVVAHMGIQNAVPKTIMQLMNVEGLTRENVASHLQKYRLYLKRMQGLSSEEGPSSSSDQLFASTPVPQSFREAMPIPMPYAAAAQMMPIPAFSMGHGHGHMAMANPGEALYHGFESHPYHMFREPRRDWSKSIISYSHMTPSDK